MNKKIIKRTRRFLRLLGKRNAESNIKAKKKKKLTLVSHGNKDLMPMLLTQMVVFGEIYVFLQLS
jgi:hypothetical protein